MLAKFWRKLKDETGITGLETAIILIAFVMVASVLAYVVLSAGLFASQKAKEAVYAGLQETRSTVDVKGNILAETSNGTVNKVFFTVALISGGQAIDFTDTSAGKNMVNIAYHDDYQTFPSVNWTLQKLQSLNNDNMLDKNELFLISIDLSVVNDNATDDQKLKAYHTFVLELKPPSGPVLILERTVPPKTNAIINLE